MRIKTKTEVCNGISRRWAYDEQGRVISEDILNAASIFTPLYRYEYDESEPNRYKRYDKDGRESCFVQDEYGNTVYSRCPVFDKPDEHIVICSDYEYDEHGNITHHKDSTGFESFNHYIYDENGNLIKFLSTSHDNHVYKYDEHNRKIEDKNIDWQYMNSIGSPICNYEYDDNGNCITKKYSSFVGNEVNEVHKEYNKNGDCIRAYSKYGDTRYIYEYYED